MRDLKGRFLKGTDDDRHTFTLDERKKGYETTAFFAVMTNKRRRFVLRRIARYYGREFFGWQDEQTAKGRKRRGRPVTAGT